MADGYSEPAPATFIVDELRPHGRAVPARDEDHGQTARLNRVDDLCEIEATAAGAEDSAASRVDVLHIIRREPPPVCGGNDGTWRKQRVGTTERQFVDAPLPNRAPEQSASVPGPPMACPPCGAQSVMCHALRTVHVESTIAVLDAKYCVDAIVLVEAHDDFANNCVQPWGQLKGGGLGEHIDRFIARVC
jgi:hypothetical protein